MHYRGSSFVNLQALHFVLVQGVGMEHPNQKVFGYILRVSINQGILRQLCFYLAEHLSHFPNGRAVCYRLYCHVPFFLDLFYNPIQTCKAFVEGIFTSPSQMFGRLGLNSESSAHVMDLFHICLGLYIC